MKASVVGLLVFFVLGIAAKYIIVVPRATKLDLPRKRRLGAFLVLTGLISVIFLGAWAADGLNFSGNSEFTPEAAVFLALFSTVATMLILFECVGPENVLVYSTSAGSVALHAGVSLFSEHQRWNDVAVAAMLMMTGGTCYALGISRSAKTFME